MNNTLQPNTHGEKINFSQLINEYSITIPIIQRDYAQGRYEQIEVRTTFLNTLRNALINDKPINLDFIYGNIKDGSLIPLDGQQRLTTLFLLHWYLANKEGKFEDLKRLLINNDHQIKFSYETRSSSKKFCDGLINFGIDYQNLLLEEEKTTSVSETIKDSAWYFLSWQYDPTVRSMLNMLDAIHQKFLNKTDNYFTKLIDDQHPLITFQFLKLDDFKLTDDIYIKMNSRGKLLTPFETFKAWLQKHIQKATINIKVDKWQNKLDIEWTDIFWKYKKNDDYEIDDEYYNYFILMTLYYYIDAEKIKIEKNRISDDYKREIIIELLNEEKIKHLTFKNSLNEPGLNKTFRLLSYFENEKSQNKLEIVLNKLSKSNNILKMIFGVGDSSKKLTLWDKTYVYSFISFILKKNKNIRDYDQNDLNQLFNWMRVCKNLVYNTIIDRPGDLVYVITQINKLSKQCFDIYQYLCSTSNKITGFSQDQLIEERIKAKLILNDKKHNWKDEFVTFENHEYFYGQIGFLLDYSKVKGQYNFNKFRNYALKASILFRHDLHDNSDFLVERALLGEGDYLINRGPNKNFCKYESGTLRLREENWRRVFRDPKKRIIFQSLLDKISKGKEKQGLCKTINNFKNKNNWRFHFIKNKQIIEYCKEKNIRYKDKNNIILLRKSMLSGYHAEYNTYGFYTQFVKEHESDYKPFTKVDYNYTVGWEDPCIVFEWEHSKSRYEMDVYFENGQFKFYFYHIEKSKINNNIKKILGELNFKKDKQDNEDKEYYIKNVKTNKEVYLKQKILELCEKLK